MSNHKEELNWSKEGSPKVDKTVPPSSLDDNDLSVNHAILHSMWDRLESNESVEGWTVKDVIDYHMIVVEVLQERDIRHHYQDSLDQSVEARKNLGPTPFVDVIKGLGALPLQWDKILDHARNVLNTGSRTHEIIWGEPKLDDHSFADAEEVDDSPLEGRDIYFYSEIDRYEALAFIKTLKQFRKDSKNEANPIIRLHIHSMGGGVFGGFSMMDEMLSIRKDIPIDTYIEGAVASAATLLSVVGTKRYIQKNSFFLMHQVSASLFFGTYTNFQDTEKNLTLFMEKLKAVYQEYTKVPPEVMEDLLVHDLWLSAEQCLEWGIVDVIL